MISPDREPKILVIDDDETWLEQVPLILEECKVDCYPTIDQGMAAVESEYYDVVLLDLNFEGDNRSGIEIFRLVHGIDRGTDVIVVSGETDHMKLIEVFNAGVTRFIPKMSPPDKIREAVQKTLDERRDRQRALSFINDKIKMPLIGSSPQMQKLRSEIKRVATHGFRDILLQGETGTGKELVAKAIAFHADPAIRLMILHCGAISDSLAESEFFGHVRGAFTGALNDRAGAFEAAGGGFVFLDEIGELPKSQQAKLLRVLQERKIQRVGTNVEKTVKFRSISATHVDLKKAVKEGKFREDLYYRVAKEVVRIAPLRERPEDIPELFHFFKGSMPKSVQKDISSRAMGLLQSYPWPGNVRQLKATVETLMSKCNGKVVRESDICTVLPEVGNIYSSGKAKSLIGKYGASLIMNERNRFEKAIISSDGDRDLAAKNLGLSRATFYRRAKELGLVKPRRRRRHKADSIEANL